MKILKIIGIACLILFAFSGAIQLLFSGLALVAAFMQNTNGNISYIIGRFTGSILIETLIIVGLVKLIGSVRRSKDK